MLLLVSWNENVWKIEIKKKIFKSRVGNETFGKIKVDPQNQMIECGCDSSSTVGFDWFW